MLLALLQYGHHPALIYIKQIKCLPMFGKYCDEG